MRQHAEPLSRAFLDRLRAFARRRVRSDADADDVVQDVLVKLVARGEEVPGGSVHAWLFTVARRVIIDRFRAGREHDPLPDGLPPDDSGRDGNPAAELARCLEPMLESLNDADRAILARVDMAGESQAAIARELGLSPSAVKSRVQRARARLRAVLTDCCAVVHDSRGAPIDYELRQGRNCPCGNGPEESGC